MSHLEQYTNKKRERLPQQGVAEGVLGVRHYIYARPEVRRVKDPKTWPVAERLHGWDRKIVMYRGYQEPPTYLDRYCRDVASNRFLGLSQIADSYPLRSHGQWFQLAKPLRSDGGGQCIQR